MKSHSVRIQARPIADALESRRGPTVGERVVAFLRQRYPAKTALNVSADTRGRIPVATIKTWLQRGSAPDADGYTDLWIAYGPDFLAVLAEGRTPEWLDRARRDLEAAHLKAEIAALQAKLSEVRA